jgi:spermidine synthase
LRNIVVAICFFLSGGSGLVFESLWTRKLTQVFGSTTLSVASVLTTFMGGLALGSWLLGRHLADRVKRPIVWYAAVEGLVGLWGLLVPLVVDGVYPHVNRFLWSTFEPGYFTFSFLRFVFVALLLLPPTTLMGATLPLLARHFVTTDQELRRIGRRVGALYSLNTLGAILGTFAAGFLLLPSIGFLWTNFIASLTNIVLCGSVLVAFVVLGIKRLAPAPALPAGDAPPTDDEPHDGSFSIVPPGASATSEDPTTTTTTTTEEEGERYALGKRARIAALIAFGVSGFASMNYQVAWNRVLAMVIGSSVYSFTIILLAFLIGIAGGSAIASAALRRMRHPVLWLGLVQLWIGLTSAVSYFLADDYPYLFAWLVDHVGAVGQGEGRVGLVLLVGFAVAALAVLPATLGMGATLPLTVRICATARERVGRDVGTIYAVNTVGAIVGSFASAFILVPGFSALSRSLFGQGYGLQLTIAFSILLNLGLAVMLFLLAPDRRRGEEERAASVQVFRWTSVTLVPTLAVLLVALTVLRGWTWDIDRMVAGSFRLAYLHSILTGERRGELLYLSDGISTTVTVQRWGEHIALKNNGKVDASTGDDMPTQVMVAGLPLLLHPHGPKGLKVAVIGFGSGVTVGTVLRMPVARVDVVELEPAVIESSWHFRGVNLLPYAGSRNTPQDTELQPLRDDPRLRVLSNDGRNFLASTPERYDVVVSEPSNPWITGVSNLFTLDHFLAARQALAKGGVFAQWVQLYEMSTDTVKSILRTFAEAFPHVLVFAAAPGSSDTILLGSLEPLPLRIDSIRLRLADPDASVALAEPRSDIVVGNDVPARLLFASRDELLDFTRGAALNTDDGAYVEFRAPRDLIRYAVIDAEIIDRIYGGDWNYGHLDLAALRTAGYDLSGPRATAEIHGITEALVRMGRLRWAAELVRAAAAAPDVPFAPQGDPADDLARVLRAAVDPAVPRPNETLFESLRTVLQAESQDPLLAADITAAYDVYRSAWERPAVTAWLLARAAARRRERGPALPPRSAFLLDVVRGAVEDEAAREGIPIAWGLPPEWQPLLTSLTDHDVADALRSGMSAGTTALTRPARPGGRAAIDVALDWTTQRLKARGEDEAIPPDADAHAVRLLMQHVLLLTEHHLPGQATPPEPSVEKALRDWRGTFESAFDRWSGDAFVRVLPELSLVDTAVAARADPWMAAEKIWSYVRLARVRHGLLETGDEWMEAHGPLLPSPEAVAAGCRPPAPRLQASGSSSTAAAPPDAGRRYAEFLAAVRAGQPGEAANAWRAATDEARAQGTEAQLLEAVPQNLADFGLACALLRAGRTVEAWEAFRNLLTDAKLRGQRSDLPYFAARALYGWRSAMPVESFRTADDRAARGDLLLAWQLMDRWVRSGGNAAPRILVDGIAALEPAQGRTYVPLVSEGLVRMWFDDNALAARDDAAGLVAAFLAGDDQRVDALLAAAGDAALQTPKEGQWGGTIADDGSLGPFAQLPQGVNALLFFDALVVPRPNGPHPDRTALAAALDRFAGAALPTRLDVLRNSAAFRFLEACLRWSWGEQAVMRTVLSGAMPAGAPPGSPLAQLLAGSAPARYHLARLIAHCDATSCRPPAAPELHRALALAGTVAYAGGAFVWEAEYRDPYRRVETAAEDLGTLVVGGSP